MHAIHYYHAHIKEFMVHADTILVSWFVIACFALFAFHFRSTLSLIPGYVQSIVEVLVKYFYDLAESMAGHKGRQCVPYIFSLFLFVLGCNWLGLLPEFIKFGNVRLMPPTRDINTTLALAIISFFAFHIYGFKEKGVRYLLHYIYPIPLLVKSLPKYLYIIIPPLFVLFVFLNIVEEFARVLSLSVRLMGNILGEHIVAGSLIMFFGIVLGLNVVCGLISDILPIFVLFLGMLTGAIQAFIFAVLNMSYIAHAVEDEH